MDDVKAKMLPVTVSPLVRDSGYVNILFLAADPTDASRLRLGEEFREIQEELKLGKQRERFRVELPQLSVRPADISQALLDYEPQIVHFSGHGTPTGALCFENRIGEAHLVEPDALAALFELFANRVNRVLLNACYSDAQARAIAEHVKYVIGMSKEISDKAAIAFVTGFYQALGAGRTIEGAYKLGCAQISLQGVPEEFTPVLIKKRNKQSYKQVRAKPSASRNALPADEQAHRLAELEEHLRLLRHYEDIRQQIRELQHHLPFWPPERLAALDLSKGMRGDAFGGLPPLKWIPTADGHWLRALDERFDPVIQHLESSDQKAILQALKNWKKLGGDCIERCHRLHEEIEREAERETGLSTIFSDSSRPAEPGLWNAFSWTIYRWAVGPTYDWDYTIAAEVGNLRLLQLLPEHSNLAWIQSEEIGRVKALHQRLMQNYRESHLAKGITDLVRTMTTVDQQITDGLAIVSKLAVITGKCGQCASPQATSH
ncbi:MAG: CHAT domain-containing protein [Chloroflexi bacterium]|nr:CHAT domain-containing protein [Chloroflexota bacterium]